MKIFVNILLSGLFLSSAPTSVLEQVFVSPFIRCHSLDNPKVNKVALYAHPEGEAGIVVLDSDYLLDDRFKSTSWGKNLPLIESKILAEGEEGIQLAEYSYGNEWSVVIHHYTPNEYPTILKLKHKSIPLVCKFSGKN